MFYRLYWDASARRGKIRVARIEKQSDLDISWRVGQKFSKPPVTPIICELSKHGGPDLPDAFLAERIPIFSEPLVNILKSADVDNLDCYTAHVVTPDGIKSNMNYFAVNILNLVRATDHPLPTIHGESMPGMIEFHRLCIKEELVHGKHLFRLYENPSFIIASEKVSSALSKVPLIDVLAIPLNDPSAY